MMMKLFYSFDGILVALYFLLFLVYVKSFLSNHVSFKRVLTVALPTLLILHFIKLLLQGIMADRCPLVAFHETFSFTAFALGVIYLIIERRHKYYATGAVFVGMVLLFQTIAFAADHAALPAGTRVGQIPLGYHAPIALLGMAALAASALYGGVYLIAFRLLKSKRFGTYLMETPALEAVERMQDISSVIGIVLVCIAITSGFVIAITYGQPFALYDPKIIISIAVVIIYGYAVIGSKVRAFSGRKKSVIVLVGFMFALISMTVVRLCVPTFHRF